MAQPNSVADDKDDPFNKAIEDWDRELDEENQDEEDVFIDVDALLEKYEKLMLKAVENYKKSVGKLTLGKVDPNMFEDVKVKAYGEVLPFAAVAQTVVRSNSMVTINVHDQSLLKEVCDAIHEFNRDLMPDNDGKKLTVMIPKPTVSQRDELVKRVGTRAESTKVHLRRLRGTMMKKLEKIEIPEDDRKRWEDQAQGFQGKYNTLLVKARNARQEELNKIPVDPDQ